MFEYFRMYLGKNIANKDHLDLEIRNNPSEQRYRNLYRFNYIYINIKEQRDNRI